MQTSTWTFCSRGLNSGSGALACQTDWWRLIVTPLQQETVLGCFVSHRDELFGAGRMDADGRVELRLGRAELHRDGDALDDLAGVGADHVRADHALGGSSHHELHER